MSTRFGRRSADGTYEYHDSKASLIEAQRRENREDRAALFGLIGLLIGGVLSYFSIQKWGADWPKWLKFSMVIAGAGVSYYVMVKLADWIWNGIRLLILLGFIYGLGLLTWRAL